MLIKVEDRKNVNPVKKTQKLQKPKWATLEENARMVPSFMYLSPSAEDLEKTLVTGAAAQYQKIRVKNLPIVDVQVAHLGIETHIKS